MSEPFDPAPRQRDIFLASEGDAWFDRNHAVVASRRLPDDDRLLQEVLTVLPSIAAPARVLEIGCGEGARLAWLRDRHGVRAQGIEPSARAVAAARGRGLDVAQGTADALPLASGSVDLVIFGFCLYLCDRADLFRIAAEADRVLAAPGWLAIEDFYSAEPRVLGYRHHQGVRTLKMDFRALFTWHPDYVCLAQHVRHHADAGYTDDPDEWVAVSILRKRRS